MKASATPQYAAGERGTLVVSLSERNLRALLASFEEGRSGTLVKGALGHGQIVVVIEPDAEHYGEAVELDAPWSPCFQPVQCRSCKSRYTCTPGADYYGSTCATDGQCERCLLTEAGLADAPVIEVAI